MFAINSLSLGEQLAASKREARLKAAIIGTLMGRMGVTEIDLNLNEWMDANEQTLSVEWGEFSPKVTLKIEAVSSDKPEQPAWMGDLLRDAAE